MYFSWANPVQASWKSTYKKQEETIPGQPVLSLLLAVLNLFCVKLALHGSGREHGVGLRVIKVKPMGARLKQ